MQIIEEVKQVVPAENTGADRLVQLLFCRGSARHKIIKRINVIEYNANARRKTGNSGFPLPPATQPTVQTQTR
jgi:hypothetical protein